MLIFQVQPLKKPAGEEARVYCVFGPNNESAKYKTLNLVVREMMKGYDSQAAAEKDGSRFTLYTKNFDTKKYGKYAITVAVPEGTKVGEVPVSSEITLKTGADYYAGAHSFTYTKAGAGFEMRIDTYRYDEPLMQIGADAVENAIGAYFYAGMCLKMESVSEAAKSALAGISGIKKEQLPAG